MKYIFSDPLGWITSTLLFPKAVFISKVSPSANVLFILINSPVSRFSLLLDLSLFQLPFNLTLIGVLHHLGL